MYAQPHSTLTCHPPPPTHTHMYMHIHIHTIPSHVPPSLHTHNPGKNRYRLQQYIQFSSNPKRIGQNLDIKTNDHITYTNALLLVERLRKRMHTQHCHHLPTYYFSIVWMHHALPIQKYCMNISTRPFRYCVTLNMLHYKYSLATNDQAALLFSDMCMVVCYVHT